jgi:serine/threonine protein kinase
MLANKYKLIVKLNQGSFGQVYKAENIRTGEHVAIKIEAKSADINSLKAEAKVYQYLANLDGFPKLKWYGSTDKVVYLVTNLLDYSVSDLVKKQGVLDAKLIIQLGKQMFQRLRVLHDHYLIHRDIKPENFMIDVSTNTVFLIDFGFCKRYNYDGTHIEHGSISCMIGTPNFVSINVHKGVEPSRRDDIESCLYVLLYMCLGKLSWEKETDSKNMCLKKEQLTNNNRNKNKYIPNFLIELFDTVRALDFTESPDYTKLIDILENTNNTE